MCYFIVAPEVVCCDVEQIWLVIALMLRGLRLDAITSYYTFHNFSNQCFQTIWMLQRQKLNWSTDATASGGLLSVCKFGFLSTGVA